MALFWAVHGLVNERVPVAPHTGESGAGIWPSIKALAHNRPWVAVFAFSILSSTCIAWLYSLESKVPDIKAENVRVREGRSGAQM